MTRINDNARITLSTLALAAATWCFQLGCSTTAPDPIDEMPPPASADRVITSEDTAPLTADHHLVLDLRRDGFTVDASLGATDLRHVDVVLPTGRVDALEHLITSVVDTGRLTRDDLERGFSVAASGDGVALNASRTSTERARSCWLCLCSAYTNLCVCEPTGCP